MLNCQVLIAKLPQIKQNIHLLKMSRKRGKHLIQAFLLAKVSLKKMVHKIIEYLSQCIDILTELVVLVVVLVLF